MMKKVHEFNDMIRKLRKELFGKGPERIHTVFAENMAIATLYGAEMVHMARTKMIQEVYAANSREHLEELVGAKLVNLFSDMKVEEDIAVSVFVFDKNIT